MPDPHWTRVESLFHDALTMDKQQREEFLAELRVTDDSLYQEVFSLLEHYRAEDQLFDKGAGTLVTQDLSPPLPVFHDGDHVGSYEICCLLGRGGMGEVYLARDARLGRKVALKLLPRNLADNLELIERLRREARTASALNHPNILTIYDFGQEGDLQYIVTEHIEGTSLRSHIGSLSMSQALKFARQIGEALAAANAAGIIHRDIKPENIMVRSDGYIKVLDFGLAKLTSFQVESGRSIYERFSTTGVDTAPGLLVGTIDYMSPEQIRGQRLDQQTDVWSWGVVLYEMLCGHRPFEAQTPSDVLAAILDKEPPPAWGSKDLNRILERSLAKNVKERYANLRQALDDLALINNEGSTSKRGFKAPVEPIFLIVRQKWRLLAGVLSIGFSFVAGAYFLYETIQDQPLRFESFVPLTTSGTATQASISPDGKYIAYSRKEPGGESLHLVQFEENVDTERIPPAFGQYSGITFNRDNFIYYVWKQKEVGKLYRVPLLGGSPRWIADDLDSAASFSPDYTQFVFLRAEPNEHETSLILRKLDDPNETKLVTLKWPSVFINTPVWSNDGGSILFSAQFYSERPGKTTFKIMLVDAMNGKQENAINVPWYWAGKPIWINGGRGIAIAAEDIGSNRAQIVKVSWPEGEVSRITHDPSDYRDLDASANLEQVVTLQSDRRSSIWNVPLTGQATPRPVTSGGRFYGIAWASSGKLLSQTETVEHPDLWLIDLDNGDQQLVTSDSFLKEYPVISPDGKSIIYASAQDGTLHLWRSDADGAHAIRMTSNYSTEETPSITADGKWVVYSSLEAGFYAVWKISMEQGTRTQITDHSARKPAVSPDGNLVACEYSEDGQSWKIAVIAMATGKPIRFFPNIPAGGSALPVRWSSDGKRILYVVTDTSDTSNIWAQPLGGDFPTQLTHFIDEQIFAFAPAPQGTSLACLRGRKTVDVVLMRAAK